MDSSEDNETYNLLLSLYNSINKITHQAQSIISRLEVLEMKVDKLSDSNPHVKRKIKKPRNSGKKWGNGDIETFEQMLDEGKTKCEIAKALERTTYAIECRIERHNAVKPKSPVLKVREPKNKGKLWYKKINELIDSDTETCSDSREP